MSEVESHGIRISYDDHSKGEPALLFMPGWSGYLAAQRSFSAAHPWFQASKLEARSHFPMYEVPDEMAMTIESFAA